MEIQRMQNSQNDFEKNKVGGLTLPDFKTYKDIVIKTMQYWYQDGQINQQYRTESRNSSHIYEELTFEAKVPK